VVVIAKITGITAVTYRHISLRGIVVRGITSVCSAVATAEADMVIAKITGFIAVGTGAAPTVHPGIVIICQIIEHLAVPASPTLAILLPSMRIPVVPVALPVASGRLPRRAVPDVTPIHRAVTAKLSHHATPPITETLTVLTAGIWVPVIPIAAIIPVSTAPCAAGVTGNGGRTSGSRLTIDVIDSYSIGIVIAPGNTRVAID